METPTKTMGAVVIEKYGGPEALRFRSDVDVPTPNANQVLVKMKAAGINSVDGRIREGTYLPTLFKPRFTLGLDGAGVIQQVGDGVTKFKPGDRVYVVLGNTGTYADYVRANEGNVYPLHDTLSFKQGAVLGIPYFGAYRALVKRGRFVKGDNVLIQGASGQVGLACIQIACGLGASFIVGAAGTTEGRDLAVKSGADVVLDYRAEDFKDQLKGAFSGRQIDIIVEMNSDINMDLDFDVIGSGGRIVIVGKRGETKCDPAKLMAKEAAVMGSGFRLSTEEERIATATVLYEAAAEGWLRPHVNKEYSLEEAETAHKEMENHKGAVGKSIFVL